MKKTSWIGLLVFSISTCAIASSTKLNRTITDLEWLIAGLERFKADVGRYPTSNEGLEALLSDSNIEQARNVGYIKKLFRDPWGNSYQYQYPATRNVNGFDLWSKGADGLPGGNGANADIGNWPNGYEEHKSFQRNTRIEIVSTQLQKAVFFGLVLSSLVYLGVSILGQSRGSPRKQSLKGKSTWILLAVFVIYWLVAIPVFMLQT